MQPRAVLPILINQHTFCMCSSIGASCDDNDSTALGQAGDASMKVPKLIRIHGGDQPFKSLYTLMNGYGEIVGAWFLENDTCAELKPMLEGVNRRFKELGMGKTLIMYTDNCCGGDRKLFKECFESLTEGLELQEAKKLRDATFSTLSNTGFLYRDSDQFKVEYITEISVANTICLALLTNNSVCEIGLDAEWQLTRPNDEVPSWVDVLTLATPTRVIVFHLSAICGQSANPNFPRQLKMLLKCPQKTFVGRAIKGDLTRLGNHYFRNRDEFRDVRTVDIADQGKSISRERFGKNLALQWYCRDVLKLHLPKGEVRTSNWRCRPLIPDQLKYAAIDAVVHLRIYTELSVLGRKLGAGLPGEGDYCDLLSYGHGEIVAAGLFLGHQSDTLSVLSISVEEVQNRSALVPQTADVDEPRQSLGDIIDGGEKTVQTREILWRTADLQKRPAPGSDEDEGIDGEGDAMDVDAPAGADQTEKSAEELASFWDGDPDFPRQRVLLDVLHAMKRVTDTIDKSHSLRPVFCSRLRDVIFCICDADVEMVKDDLLERGWTAEEVDDFYRHRYSYFVSKARRAIKPPKELLADFDALIQLFASDPSDELKGRCNHTGELIFRKRRTEEAIQNLRIHIEKGCLSDPENFNMYYNIGSENKPNYRTFRGTSALEGYHHHLRRMFSGFSTSPQLAHALISEFNHRWNIKQGINHRLDADFGHKNLILLETIAVVERELDAKPLVGLRLTSDVADTNEVFLYSPLQTEAVPNHASPDMRHKVHQSSTATEGEFDSTTADSIKVNLSVRGIVQSDAVKHMYTDPTGAGKCQCSVCTPMNSQHHGSAESPVNAKQAIFDHVVNCGKVLEDLKPTHAWVALRSQTIAPAFVSRQPTESEWAYTKQLISGIERSQASSNGHKFGTVGFKEMFLIQWNKACYLMSTGVNKDLKIGVMTKTSCDRYLDMYRKHLNTKVSYEHIKTNDLDFLKQMRAPGRYGFQPAQKPVQSSGATADTGAPTASPSIAVVRAAKGVAATTVAASGPSPVRKCVRCGHLLGGDGPFGATAHASWNGNQHGNGKGKGSRAVCGVDKANWVKTAWEMLDRKARHRKKKDGWTAASYNGATLDQRLQKKPSVQSK